MRRPLRHSGTLSRPLRSACASRLHHKGRRLVLPANSCIGWQVTVKPFARHRIAVQSACQRQCGLIDVCKTACRYILFKFAFISVSRFSLSLAVSVGAVAFSALQSTSMFLVTTPPEQMALAFRWFATPLAWLGAPVQRTTFLLLLSLRFVSLVRSIPSAGTTPACGS